MALIPIEQDVHVQQLIGSDGIDTSSLTDIDRSRIAAWSGADRLTRGEGIAAGTWRDACIAGVAAFDAFSDGVAIGHRKFILYQTGLNAALYFDGYGSDDAYAFGAWALATVESNGWGPDGNASPLGTLHSVLMARFGVRMNPVTGQYESASRDAAAAIALAARFAAHSLPSVNDVLIAELVQVGESDYLGLSDDPFAERHPLEGMLRQAPIDVVEDYVAALADRAIAVDGWALYAAAEVVMRALSGPETFPSYRRLQRASLESRRARNFWEFNLSPHEIAFWRVECGGGDQAWLPTRTPPAEHECTLTPMQIGEQRQISQMASWEDSNLILVQRVEENRYVAIVDQAQSRGNPEAGRVQNQTAEAGTLYDLYRTIGPQIPSPQHDIDPEFEPFLRHERPSLPTGSLRPKPPVLAPPETLAANWYADPSGRHQHRYWDGAAWTAHVADDGVAGTDEQFG